MKAQIHNKSQVEKMLAKLIDEKRAEIFNDVAFDIGRQMVAIDIAVLEKEFGFKEPDIRKFLKHVSAVHSLLASNPNTPFVVFLPVFLYLCSRRVTTHPKTEKETKNEKI